MEKIKSFKFLMISIIVVCILFGFLFYFNYISKQNYNYKGVFVIDTINRSGNNGDIYKNS
jgi:hypothetical protein